MDGIYGATALFLSVAEERTLFYIEVTHKYIMK